MHKSLIVACVGAAVGASASLPGAAQAQTASLIAGEVKLAVGATKFGGSCYVNRGFSTFQRNGGGSKAVISFDEIVDNGVWDLHGQAIMTFATPTSGDIRFKQTPTVPAGTRDPSFSNYTMTYDPVALQVVVTFTINFPDCSLPILAAYDVT